MVTVFVRFDYYQICITRSVSPDLYYQICITRSVILDLYREICITRSVILDLYHQICLTRYPIHIGLNEGIISPMEPHGLPTDVETLADLLLAAGYSTHAVGRIAGSKNHQR